MFERPPRQPYNKKPYLNPFARKEEYKVYTPQGSFGRTAYKGNDAMEAKRTYDQFRQYSPNQEVELSRHSKNGLFSRQKDETLDVSGDLSSAERVQMNSIDIAMKRSFIREQERQRQFQRDNQMVDKKFENKKEFDNIATENDKDYHDHTTANRNAHNDYSTLNKDTLNKNHHERAHTNKMEEEEMSYQAKQDIAEQEFQHKKELEELRQQRQDKTVQRHADEIDKTLSAAQQEAMDRINAQASAQSAQTANSANQTTTPPISKSKTGRAKTQKPNNQTQPVSEDKEVKISIDDYAPNTTEVGGETVSVSGDSLNQTEPKRQTKPSQTKPKHAYNSGAGKKTRSRYSKKEKEEEEKGKGKGEKDER